MVRLDIGALLSAYMTQVDDQGKRGQRRRRVDFSAFTHDDFPILLLNYNGRMICSLASRVTQGTVAI